MALAGLLLEYALGMAAVARGFSANFAALINLQAGQLAAASLLSYPRRRCSMAWHPARRYPSACVQSSTHPQALQRALAASFLHVRRAA